MDTKETSTPLPEQLHDIEQAAALLSRAREAETANQEREAKLKDLEEKCFGTDGNGGFLKRFADAADSIEATAGKVATAERDVMDFHSAVHGDEEKKSAGLKQELAELKAAFAEQAKAQREAFETRYKQIEDLLPGAAAAGLAAGYHAQKIRHDRPIQVWSWVFSATMVAMALYALITFHEPSGFKQAVIQISSRIPFLLPVVWLAWHATKQQSQHKRIQQEYAHKESLATTYVGYSNEVEKLPDSPAKNALREKLLSNILEMSAMNPSSTLEHISHKDGPPIVDQVKNLVGEVQKIAAIVKPGS